MGARALGMGGAFAGIADDATALYWNPAGLSLLKKGELTATAITLFEDTNYDFVGYAKPLRRYGTLGLGVIRETSGNFDARTNPFDTPTSFSITNSLYQLSWGMAVPKVEPIPGEFRLGASLKQIQQTIASAHASSAGGDLGLLYLHPRGVSLGAYFQNLLAPRQTFVSQSVTYPRGIDIAPAYTRAITPDLRAVASLRLNMLAGNASFSGGAELQYGEHFAVRAGFQERGLSTGIGLRLMNYQVDYALVFNEVAPSHVVSLGIRFGKTKEELEAEIRRGIQKINEEDAGRLGRSYYQQGVNYAREGNFVKAVSYLDTAVLLSPDDKKAANKLAEVKVEMEAAANRQLVEQTSQLALREYQRKNFLASLEQWKTVLQIDPNNAQAKEYISRIENSFGTQERTRLQEAQAENRRAQVRERLARARGLLEEGRLMESFREARAVYEQLDRGNKDALEVAQAAGAKIRERDERLYQEGLDQFEKRDFRKASKLFEAILKDVPKYPGAADKLEECRAALSASASPETKKQVERLYYQAVDQYLKGGYASSRKTLGQIFELDPSHEASLKLKERLEATLQNGGTR